MSAQIIPFPARQLPLDPLAEQFYQHALGKFPKLRESRSDLGGLMIGVSMWIICDRWRQRAGLGDIAQPDFGAIERRIIRHNSRH